MENSRIGRVLSVLFCTQHDRTGQNVLGVLYLNDDPIRQKVVLRGRQKHNVSSDCSTIHNAFSVL